MEHLSPRNAAPPDSATTCEVSAVLLAWRRHFHLRAIVDNLRRFPQVREVLIFANEFRPPDVPGATIIFSPENQVTYGRFIGARHAQCECVFVQDDDLLVHNLPALLAAYSREPQIVANLADDRSSRHWSWWQARRPPWVELGFGSVFPRDWAMKLDDWPYDRSLLRRKADKVFSIVQPWQAMRAGPEDITRLFHEGKESGRDANALSNRVDHQTLTDQAVDLAKEWAGTLASTAG
jgi:hypothetical protein